ncbi:MAG: ATP-binding protein [Chloroflexi bacterium]|nr:ATP-binding protein [Chloroflexota bacterium]
MEKKIPKRISTAIVQSLAAGVVPRVGLEYIAVGRKDETTTLLNDLDHSVSQGGASFRLILGRYGSGKSFLCQLIRNYALQRNYVVADADFSPVRRLTGTKGEGLALYRELLNNIATRTRPDGNAFTALLERWISEVQSQVTQQEGLSPTAPDFPKAVERRIHATIDNMEGMVHGFDFATALSAYWSGYQAGDDTRQDAALRWLRGEYATKAEAREALGVRVIIDDGSWYDYIKLLAKFVRDIGYQGLVIFLDEAVNLYKISNTIARQNNYERLLTIFNDALQGKAEHLGILICGTPQMVEDRQRGLFSYDAIRTRLEESRFARENGLRDLSGPMIRLETLTHTEIFALLLRLQEVHAMHFDYTAKLSHGQIQQFMDKILNRLNAEQLLTPREVVRDFIAVLNIMHQNPNQSFEAIIGSATFTPTPSADPEALTADSEIRDEESADKPYKNFNI